VNPWARGLRVARFGRWLLVVPAALFALPLAGSLLLGLSGASDLPAWHGLIADSQFAPGLRLSLWVGSASLALSLLAALWLVTHLHGSALWVRVQTALGPMLALPHAAFAVGLGLLLMPSGLPARLIALVAGWSAPPDVATVQDRFGLALIAGLVLKEVPFLLWNVMALLQRAGQGAQIERQLQVAAGLGYPARSVWWRVLWPQLLPRLALPLLAVWAYSLTVVDMALVLGPTQPPTLALLAWGWLQDADALFNRQGASAALLLTALTFGGALLGMLLWRMLRPVWLRRSVRGDRALPRHASVGARGLVNSAAGVYASVLALLVFTSFVGVWSFPSLSPQLWSFEAWASVLRSASTVGWTLLLALASAGSGLVVAVAWLENTPAHWDERAAPWVLAPMLVPGVLLVAGLYRLTLWLGIDGRFAGLWLAHGLFTAPYALVALAPAYRGFDLRYEQTAHALGRTQAEFLWHVKWPMLLAPIAAAFAVAFAVSVTQYLSTQFVGAGRYATLTTEALTLASGGQRSTVAAFALMQALLPALVFGAALWLGRAQARRSGDTHA
jgi:putative thiamine transport system permease protein